MRTIWVYSDADNTLWDTDGVFLRAQLQLLEAAEKMSSNQGPQEDRLEFVRRLDQAIALKHHSGLRYPPLILLRCLQAVLSGVEESDAVKRLTVAGVPATQSELEAINLYAATINDPPPLLAGVRDGLELAHKEGLSISVLTEGPLEVAKQRVRLHQLSHLVVGVLSATKTTELYVRLLQRVSPKVAAMIGDQSDKDVRLAHQAGLLTVLVPGRFRPTWAKSRDLEVADAVCTDFKEAILWLISAEPPESHGLRSGGD